MSDESSWLILKHRAALDHGTMAHAAHARKDTEASYLTHLIGGAELSFRDGADETEAIAAPSYDLVEVQGERPRLDDIGRPFDPRVVRAKSAEALCAPHRVIPLVERAD